MPVSVIAKGDPYQRQIQETVETGNAAGRWLTATGSVIRARSARANGCSRPCTAPSAIWAAERIREVCIVPIAFVSDHVETLGEIDHEAREEARSRDTQFEMMSGLNDYRRRSSPLWRTGGQLRLARSRQVKRAPGRGR